MIAKKRELLALALLLAVCLPVLAAEAEIDKETGLVIAPGFETVKKTCTVCHAAMMITQNKADRDGWLEMIRWMQAKQNLWPFEPEMSSVPAICVTPWTRSTTGLTPMNRSVEPALTVSDFRLSVKGCRES